MNGKDFASPRYIWTKLEDLTSIIFNKLDNPVLEKQYEDGYEIEPTCYAPIIPMILVNGAAGIGTGYSTNIPCFNPVDVIQNIKILLENQKNSTDTHLKKILCFHHEHFRPIRKVDLDSFFLIGWFLKQILLFILQKKL